jgi:orotate phosphoribosyltransferase
LQQQLAAFRTELLDLLCRKSFHYSPEPVYRLASGQLSRFYVNCRPVTLNPRGMRLIGDLFFQRLNPSVRGIGGLTFGADPIAIATAFVSELAGRPVQAFSIRKTRKDHGMVRWIEGELQAGDPVAVIDDVATTGGSTLQAIERARQEGLTVVQAIILVDRQEGGLENIRQQVADTTAVFTRDALMAHLQQG